MATKGEHLHLQVAHFQNFKEHLPNWHEYDKKTLESLLQDGLLEVSTCFENAVANAGGHEVISENHADLSDGSDCKTSSARIHSYGTGYSAPVSNIATKTGTLRIQVYERIQHEFYYFKIPHTAYEHRAPKSNIDIPFDIKTGEPKRVSRVGTNKMWIYEVDSFEEMCKNEA
jgi:hypothetical protein